MITIVDLRTNMVMEVVSDDAEPISLVKYKDGEDTNFGMVEWDYD